MLRQKLRTLLILTLIVAALMALDVPVLVWDALTLRTVEEYWETDEFDPRPDQTKLLRRYRVRWWVTPDRDTWMEAMLAHDYEEWYENGEKAVDVRTRPVLWIRSWSERGELLTNVVAGTGISTDYSAPYPPYPGLIVRQERLIDDVVVEEREQPPWFTEADIQRSARARQVPTESDRR